MKAKKIFALILATLSASCLFACKDDSKTPMKTFIDLKNNQTLFVGEEESFVNIKTTETEEQYLTYVLDYQYSLVRSYYSNSSNSVLYDGYYYSWNINTTQEDLLLGKATTTRTISYAYLPYGEGEQIAVKGTVRTETSYDYPGGFVEKPFTYDILLNGYFASYAALKEACPELAAQIDVTGKKKYYIDVTTPISTYQNVENYTDTYYYLIND